MSAAEVVDIDLYADELEQEFSTEADEFSGEGVDLYDDVISSSGGRHDSEDPEGSPSPISAESSPNVNNVNNNKVHSTGNHNDSRDRDRDRDRDIMPLRKHQLYVGNLTWWTSDKDIQDALVEIGVNDFIEVKFYENRANGQSKGYCVLTVGSDSSLKLIHEKLSKKELHGQYPAVTPPTKQALNQFEAQAKTRPSPSGNQGGNDGSGRNSGGPNNMGMNMMGGPRGPMMGGPMQGQMGMGMGYGGGPRMMMGPNNHGPMRGGPRGMGPPMGPGQMPVRGMGPPNHGGPGFGPPRQMPPQNSLPPIPGPGPRMPMMMHGGPGSGPMGRGPMPPGMMDPRGPPPRNADWSARPPNNPEFSMNNYLPHGQAPMSPNGPPHIRGQVPPPQMAGGPPPSVPAPHMNPAFFHNAPGGAAPGPSPGPFNSPGTQLTGYHPPPMEHRSSPAMSESEFEEVMSRNRTVSSSAISRAVQDAATGEFASAIETLVTAISLIKQSKVAQDDRCKILISSLQDTLHGIEAKSYGTGRRERSRSRDRHRRSRRERTRSRESYRDRSRERYYEYPRERSRSREREYRERPRDETNRAAYYEDRYRERDRERERERVPRPEPDRSRERERERESDRDPAHRAPRH